MSSTIRRICQYCGAHIDDQPGKGEGVFISHGTCARCVDLSDTERQAVYNNYRLHRRGQTGFWGKPALPVQSPARVEGAPGNEGGVPDEDRPEDRTLGVTR